MVQQHFPYKNHLFLASSQNQILLTKDVLPGTFLKGRYSLTQTEGKIITIPSPRSDELVILSKSRA